MAVLALAAAGAALAPAGYAAIGWSIGMVAGQMLFPGSLPDVQGPRIGDLRAQQSTYGAAIPIIYGTYRVAGNVIWSTDLLETANTVTQGGKGGPSQTQTTYTYRVSMAVLIGEGPITGIRKIWADGRLIYNVEAAADPATVAASARLAPGITVYLGSETQQPDPTMQAWLGVANVPAYRGRAYIVFADFQLADYGNRRPNFTFETVRAGSVANTVNYGTMPVPGSRFTDLATDGNRLLALDFNSPLRVSESADGLTWSPFRAVVSGIQNGWCCAYVRDRWLVAGGSNICTSFDALTWSSLTAPTSITAVADNGAVCVGVSAQGGRPATTADFFEWTLRDFPELRACNDICWTGSQFIAVADNGVTFRSANGISWTAGNCGLGGADVTHISSNGAVTIAVRRNAATAVARTTDGINWTQHTVAAASWGKPQWVGNQWIMPGSSIANGSATSADGATWAVFSQPQNQQFGGSAVFGASLVAISDAPTTGVSGLFRYGVITPQSVTLASIITDLAQRAGLTVGDIDASALTDQVQGYAVGQQMSVRQAVEPLQRTYYVDAVESGNVIAFRPRGAAPVRTIDASELAAHAAGDELPEDLPITRQQEVELPARVSIAYVNPTADYQQSVQHAQRVTTLSRQQVSVEVPVVLSDDRARQMAETLMYDAWTQRSRYQLRVDRRHAVLEPADVITVNRNGTAHRLRVQQRAESRSGVIELDCVAEEASLYSQSAAGGSSVAPDATVRVAPTTRLELLDIPLLRDQDSTQGLYVAACGLAQGWNGVVIYRSTDSGASYDEAAAVVNAAAIGYAQNAMGNFSGGNIVDELSVVDVVLFSGQLSSITLLAMLNGGNAALLGSEIVQFRDAALIGTNTYRLTGFLRARRGTEWAMTTHAANERFVLLTPQSIRRIAAELNLARAYKAVSIGRTIQETPAQSATYTGINLECLSPAQLGGGRAGNGDLTINWVRRTRISGEWNDNADVPLGETTESYEVEIWNSAFSVLRRTVTGLSTATTTYTDAQQAADSGGRLSSYGIRVFQLSAVVGRGFFLQGTL